MGQGFTSLREVEQAVLNPNGPFAIVGKKDHAESYAYHEILTRIDHLAELLGRLQPDAGPAGR